MKKSNDIYLKHIVDAIDKVSEFIGNQELEDFYKDEKTQSAVIRQIEIIGEATRNISSALQTKESDIPWGLIIGMRNKLIHNYFEVDGVWEIDLPQLKQQIQRLV
jgi:uncharacterized protein with HEPN domain